MKVNDFEILLIDVTLFSLTSLRGANKKKGKTEYNWDQWLKGNCDHQICLLQRTFMNRFSFS